MFFCLHVAKCFVSLQRVKFVNSAQRYKKGT
nr:MAG TPA: hypothetical protein [Caudoviricetes sp.]